MRLSLSKARTHLKQTALSSDAKLRTIITSSNGFKMTSEKLSIPNFEQGEYQLEVVEILDDQTEKSLTKFEFEILESDQKKIETEPESITVKSIDPKDEIIEFYKKQIDRIEQGFSDKVNLAIQTNDAIWKSKLDRVELELKLEKSNQAVLEQSREKLYNSIEKQVRTEVRFQKKPDPLETFMPMIEKLLPFILPGNGDNADLLNKAKEFMLKEGLS